MFSDTDSESKLRSRLLNQRQIREKRKLMSMRKMMKLMIYLLNQKWQQLNHQHLKHQSSVEIPVELHGYILMTILTAQFPGACGLKFKTEQLSWRGY